MGTFRQPAGAGASEAEGRAHEAYQVRSGSPRVDRPSGGTGRRLPSVPLDNRYEGRVERDQFTYFGFDVVGKQGRKKVARVTAHLAYACDNNTSTRESARVDGRLPIKNRRFAGVLGTNINARAGFARGTTVAVEFQVEGRLRRNGRARGRVDAEMSGTNSARARGFAADVRCYAGEVDWRARRGADVELP